MYTHLGQGINVLRDPPKSPLKKGNFESGSPFFEGGWGGSNPVEARSEDLCVHGSPKGEGSRKSFQSPSPQGEGLKPSAYMKSVRETLGFKLDEVYLGIFTMRSVSFISFCKESAIKAHFLDQR